MNVTKLAKYPLTLSFTGVVKRFVLKLFRITRFDNDINTIFDRLQKENYSVNSFKQPVFEIRNRSNELFYLRKDTSDILVFNQVILNQEYQLLIDLILEHHAVDKITNIIDAGANIGFSALYFSQIYRQALICCIEPSEKNLAVLKLNVGDRLKARVIPIHAALWYENTTIALQSDFRDRMDWSTQVISSTPAIPGSIEALTLSTIKLRAKFNTIDILKIDIEGAEAKLFESSGFLNELKTVKFLAMEIHEEIADKIDIINKLQSIGFMLKYKGETLFGFNVAAINK